MPYEKVGKNEPVCIADEVPFDIPESWEWARLGTILHKLSDGTHSRPQYVSSGIPFISVKDVSSGKLDFSDCKYITEKEHRELYNRCNPEYGDILLTKVGTTGIPVIVNTTDEFSLFVSVALLKFNQEMLFNEYLVQLINSPLVQKQAEENTRGVGNKNWVMRDIANTLIVIPPLSEQHRIIDKLSELLPVVDDYAIAFSKADKLNTQFPELLKKSILQEAVQGKLVPQDSSDEPASVLLERIRAEKEQLIKAGKIKRDKHESVIFRRDNSHYEKRGSEVVCIDDDIPFSLPDGWCWCRFSDICYKLTDGSHNPPPKKSKGFRVISARNIKNGKILFTNEDRLCDQAGFDKENPRTQISKGDVILGIIGGSIGNTAIYEHNEPVIAQRSIAIFGALINNRYMKLLLDSPLFQQQFTSKSNGTAQGGIYLGELANMIVPLPPEAEQNRILTFMSVLEKQLAGM